MAGDGAPCTRDSCVTGENVEIQGATGASCVLSSHLLLPSPLQGELDQPKRMGHLLPGRWDEAPYGGTEVSERGPCSQGAPRLG